MFTENLFGVHAQVSFEGDPERSGTFAKCHWQFAFPVRDSGKVVTPELTRLREKIKDLNAWGMLIGDRATVTFDEKYFKLRQSEELPTQDCYHIVGWSALSQKRAYCFLEPHEDFTHHGCADCALEALGSSDSIDSVRFTFGGFGALAGGSDLVLESRIGKEILYFGSLHRTLHPTTFCLPQHSGHWCG